MNKIIITDRNFKLYNYIIDNISREYEKKGSNLNVIITGGNSVLKLSNSFKKNIFNNNFKINFFLSDERSNIKQNDEINRIKLNKYFFKDNVNKQIKFFPILKEDISNPSSIKIFDQSLKGNIDLSILSLGHNGHIASLFYDLGHDKTISKKVVKISHKSIEFLRYSISPLILKSVKRNFLLVFGEHKMKLLLSLIDQNRFDEFPLNLIKNVELLLDYKSSLALKTVLQTKKGGCLGKFHIKYI